MIYSFTYLFLFYFTLRFDFLKRNKGINYVITKYFVLFLLILIAGLRYRIAPDTVAYEWFFNDFSPLLYDFFKGNYVNDNGSYQYFWIFLNSFFYTFFDYYTFQFFVTFISVFLLYKISISFTRNTLLFFYLLFCTVYLYFSMEIIRQFLALVFLLYSLIYFSKKNNIIGFILLIIALFTHRYAFLILPFYILMLLPLNNKLKIFLYVLSYFIIYIAYIFISQYFNGDIIYFESNLISLNGILFNVVLCFILIIFMVLYRNYSNSFFNEFKNLLYSGLMGYLIMMLCKLTINPFFDRLLDYFLPFVLIFYAIILPDFFKNRFKYPLALILVLITVPIIRIYLLYGVEPFTDIRSYSRYYPYSSIIEQSLDPDREMIIRLEAKEP